jgi:hypothetical protein
MHKKSSVKSFRTTKEKCLSIAREKKIMAKAV